MASLQDLKTVLRDTLEQKGVLGQIKAKIRSEIFTALDNESVAKPKISNQNMIINELIREYLRYNKHYHTLSVFLTETGQPQEPPFDRNYISKQVNIAPMSGRVPLLYGKMKSDSDMAFGQKRAHSVGSKERRYFEEEEEEENEEGVIHFKN